MPAVGPVTQLLNLPAIGAAVSLTGPLGPWCTNLYAYKSLALWAQFTYDSGGTSVDCWVQTTLDGGNVWFDIANFHFTTSSADAAFNLQSQTAVTTQKASFGNHSITSNTCVDGLLGDQLQVYYQVQGTYGGASSLIVYALPR